MEDTNTALAQPGEPYTNDPTGTEMAEAETEAKKKGPRKPKGPKYELPTVGRVVHVVADAYVATTVHANVGEHVAAIVTRVPQEDDHIIATIFSPAGNAPKNGVYLAHDETGVMGSWHWPERTDA